MNASVPEALRLLVERPARVVITTHFNPDADAIGSSLGWAGYLQQKGHHVTVVTPSESPQYLSWMPGFEAVVEYRPALHTEVSELFARAEVIYCLDFNALSRIYELAPLVQAATARKVMIDHHLLPEAFADVLISDPAAAATAQLIYQLIENLGDKHLIDLRIGACLYAGFMTDTGSFRHPNTNHAVHRMAAELIGQGLQTSRIHQAIYDTNSFDRLRFLGHVLSKKLVYLPEFRTAYITVTTAEMQQFHSRTGDTEGFVNYALSIENVVMAVMLTERDREVRLSFRSIGEVPVNEYAREHFSGGGHKNAAGGRSSLGLEATLNRFLSLLPHWQPQLAGA